MFNLTNESDYDVNNGDGSDDDTLAKRRDRGPRSMPNKDVQMANNHNGEIICDAPRQC